MSAPQINPDRQRRRHRGPLIGIVVALIFAGLLFVIFLGDATAPEDSLLGEGATTTVPATETPAVPATEPPVPAPAPAN